MRDAVATSDIATVEVHISNIYEREEWRRFSVLSDVCDLTIVGRGTDGYLNAIDHLIAVATSPPLTTAYAKHRDALLDLRVPSGGGPHPVALLIHGGFWGDIWKRDLMDPMAVALTDLGWATANIEYTRGLGSYGSAVADVEAAAQWINDNAAAQELDAERIVAVGHSAGGYLALVLAEKSSNIAAALPLAAVSSLTTISEFRPDDDPAALLLGAARSDAPRLWDQAELTGEPAVPVHMMHGDKDDTVPAAHSEAYVSLGATKATATIVEDVGHMDLIDPCGESWHGLVAALELFRI